MGTRADFYVGRGEGAEWLGSVAWDGYPDGFGKGIREASDETVWRLAVEAEIKRRDDGTLPEMGWPWPWETSHTTDFAYAFADGKVWTSCFGQPWQTIADYEREDDDEPTGPRPVFPDMTDRKNVQMGGQWSGVIVISAPTDVP